MIRYRFNIFYWRLFLQLFLFFIFILLLLLLICLLSPTKIHLYSWWHQIKLLWIRMRNNDFRLDFFNIENNLFSLFNYFLFKFNWRLLIHINLNFFINFTLCSFHLLFSFLPIWLYACMKQMNPLTISDMTIVLIFLLMLYLKDIIVLFLPWRFY